MYAAHPSVGGQARTNTRRNAVAKTVYEKVADWKTAYDAIRVEITPDALRKVLAEMDGVDGIQQFQSYVSLAKSVLANDRAAATVAALITQSGIKPTGFDYGEDA